MGIRASPVALQQAGFKCITTARADDMPKIIRAIRRQVPSWNDIGYVVEDAKVLSHEMANLTSQVVRKTLTEYGAHSPNKKKKSSLTMADMTSPEVAKYMLQEQIGAKMSEKSCEKWTKKDHS